MASLKEAVPKSESLDTPDPSDASVFVRFAKDFDAVQDLRNALSTLCSNFAGLMTLTIKQCNASSQYGTGGAPFSKAFVDVQDNSAAGDKIYSFGTLFEEYLYKLKTYLNNSDTKPLNQTDRLLFSNLLGYLLDYDQQKIVQNHLKKKNWECEVAALLAEHFFSKLCLSPRYTLDKHYKNRSCIVTCGCGCKTDISSHYGDTSIGNPNVWHGNIDILLGYQLPVEVFDDDITDSPGKSSIEVKKQEYLEEPDVTNQIISQAIVFSFLQRKLHPEYKTLIPSVGVSKSHIIFYFYDSENDILLKSPSLSFLNNLGEVNVVTILATWFVVNYKFMCTGIQDKYFRNAKKANFFKLAQSALPVYKNELSVGGEIQADRTVVEYQPIMLTKCLFVSVDDLDDKPSQAKKPKEAL